MPAIFHKIGFANSDHSKFCFPNSFFFRAITDAFAHNQSEIFALFLEYLNPEQLSTAREYIDRIYDRNGTQERHEFRQWLIRRQNTID